MQVVILAGGLGTRVRAIRDDLPKALMPVHGTPFLAHQLAWLARQRVTSVLLSVGYRGDQIESYAGDGTRFGLRITYSHEGDELRGTAGALRHAADQELLDEKFCLLYGDSYLPIAIDPIWQYAGPERQAVMTVLRNENHWGSSNVDFRDGLVVRYSKAPDPSKDLSYIDYGLSVLDADVITREIPKGAIMDLAAVWQSLSRQEKLYGYEVFERFYEIGSPEGLEQFAQYIKPD